MPTVKILKRNLLTVNSESNYPGSFRYFIEGTELEGSLIKTGVIPAFLGFLNEVVLSDPDNFENLSSWFFVDVQQANSIPVGGQTSTINTYTGIRYVYRAAVETIIAPAEPATIGTYTGATYRYNPLAAMFGGDLYVLEDSLLIATHGIENGTFQTFDYWNGTAPIPAVTQVTNSGFYPVSGGEVGTHGQNEGDFMALSFWNENITSTTPSADECTGLLLEQNSGFSLDVKRIGLNLKSSGEALERYTPLDLLTFTQLIALHYKHRQDNLVIGTV